MPNIITMPRYGATMEEGMINSWSVKVGDAVSKGDLLCEISIEKLTNELLAEDDGVVLKILAEEGDTVACGQPILIIGAAGESLDAPGAPAPAVEKTELEAPIRTPAVEEKAGEPTQAFAGTYHASANITPKGLQLAQELGIEYHFVQGTGRFGMITREDIRAAVSTSNLPKASVGSAPPQIQGEKHKMSAMQLTIAKAMENSLKSTAQTTISMDVNASGMTQAYQAHKEAYARQGIKLTYTAILIKIVAQALVEHSLLRTVIEDTNLVSRNAIHIGVAIDVPNGLVVPNIKNCHQKSVAQIATELADMANRAKNNALTTDEMSGGTFTITNLGMFGIKYFTPVLNPGESAILGIGTIQEVPYIHEGGIFIKPIINLSLTHDHRVIMGAPAARFLQTIQQLLDGCETYL